MVKRVLLENFRRHRHSEIHFDNDRQLTLIAGRNGAGKSTIFHAIVWALCNEGPDGRRSLDNLVTRGAEPSGCRVEVDLDIDGTVYTIARERRGKTATARLIVDNQTLVEGAGAVTDAVADLLGVDGNGLRLAVYAGQGELDGLASLRPAERAVAIERLLHLDLLTKARESTRTETRAAKNAADSLGVTIDETAAETTHRQLAEQHQTLTTQLHQLDTTIADIDTQLNEGAELVETHQRINDTRTRLTGRKETLDELRRNERRQLAETAAEHGDDPGDDPVDWEPIIEELRSQANDTEQAIARGEANRHILDHRHTCAREIAAAAARRAALDSLIATVSDLQRDVDTDTAELARLETELLEAQLRGTGDPITTGPCPTCGQHIDTEHAHRLSEEHQHAAAHIAELTDLTNLTRSRLQTNRSLLEQATAAEREDAELRRRIDVWTDQLERTADLADVNLDELYATRAQLHIDLAHARQAAETDQARRERRNQLAAAHTRLTDLDRQAAELDEQLAALDPDGRIAAAVDHLHTLTRRRDTLTAERDRLREETARIEERTLAARRIAHDAKTAARRRSTLQRQAQTAADAAHILDQAASTLAGGLRPALQGSVSAILDTLSDGRFTRVALDDDYTLTVLDDGELRNLSELSGGERDLVALAVRLGLAELVADHVGGIGWILLDEVFGSQDDTRREAILAGLRGLKHRFGQILTISHVGDLPDIADRVITVTLHDDHGQITATVNG